MRRIKKRSQRTGRGTREPTDHVRQTDRVRTTPRDKREFDDRIDLGLQRIIRLPVTIQRETLTSRLVDRENVRLHAVAEVHICVDFKDGTQSILIVVHLRSAFDLVVGRRRLREVDFTRRTEVDISVHAGLYAAIVLELRNVLNMRLTLCRVEIRRGKR